MTEEAPHRRVNVASDHGAKLKLVDQALRSSDSALIVTDPALPDNPVVAINDAFTRLTGYHAADIVGRNCRVLQGQETHPEAVKSLRELVETGSAGAVTLVNYTKAGRKFLNCVQILPLKDKTGRPVLLLGSQCEVPPLEATLPMATEWTFGDDDEAASAPASASPEPPAETGD